MVKGKAVENNEAAAMMWISGHKGLCEKIKGRAVNNGPWFSHGVDKGTSCCVPQHIHLTAFCSIHEGLAHIRIDDKLARLHDLADLILRIAVAIELKTVYT